MTDLVLTVEGQRYEGWERVSVRRSIETISGSFDLTVSDNAPGQQRFLSLRPGMACTVALGSDIVITGHIDIVRPSYNAREHTVSFSGRDRTGDLVDCAAIHRTGQWSDTPLFDIVSNLCQPFGVSVGTATETGKPFAKFKLEEGETAFEAIERACRLRAVLPVSDGLGSIVLSRASRQRVGVRLERGVNILAASAEYSHRDRFASYRVKAQQSTAGWTNPENATGVLGSASDAGITRYRPHVVIAEGPMDADDATKRASWEARTRAGRARRLSVTVRGWRQTPDGALWRPNLIVPIDDDWLGVSNLDMLIANVAYRLGDEGEKTVLGLTMPDAFDLIEAVPEQESGWLK